MKLTQIRGNTWVLEAQELIPLYKLNDTQCILLDSGLVEEREELEQALQDARLTPVGILCSHAHVDHCANNGYFQKKLGIPVALTAPEAGMCSSLLTLKCYFLTLPPSLVQRDSSCMIHTPDVIIPLEDGPFPFQGATFQIIQTPGHSAGHIAVVTPDRVCYTGDAMLSREYLGSKLPYNLSHSVAEVGREKLRHLDCDLYIMAHRGTCTKEEVGQLLDDDKELVHRRAGEILGFITQPMTLSEINLEVCAYYTLLSKRPHRTLRFERNVRFFIEYLADAGKLEIICQNGVTYYRRPETDLPSFFPDVKL